MTGLIWREAGVFGKCDLFPALIEIFSNPSGTLVLGPGEGADCCPEYPELIDENENKCPVSHVGFRSRDVLWSPDC